MNILIRILFQGVLGVLIIFPIYKNAQVFAQTDELVEAGKKIFDKRCWFCHGREGRGDGPVAEYLVPRPRDFVTALFKFRTTESGYPPTDEDLQGTLERGVPGTAMPTFEALLNEKERNEVIQYIKTFSDIFTDPDLDPYKHLVNIDEISSTAETVAKGKEVYKKAECFKCHGEAGRGNGESAMGLADQRGLPILPRNLTKAWRYKGGTTVKDIYTRFTTGMDGTPMPSFVDNLTDEERWHLSYYVKTLVRDVDRSEVVIKSKYIKGDLPAAPDDTRWDNIGSINVDLTGQVLAKPRWQIPSVDLVSVRSMYNDSEIAFLLEWDDRFKNIKHDEEMIDLEGDKEFTYVKLYTSTSTEGEEEWVEEDYEEGEEYEEEEYEEEEYEEEDDEYGFEEEEETVLPQWVLRDSIEIQFPTKIPDGPIKPHFFLGNSGNPVNLWRWKADVQEDPEKNPAVEEYNATGFKNPIKVQPAESQTASSNGYWEDGRWRVVVKRTLATEDKRKDIQFERGKLIPIAFHVRDGSNGEVGLKMSISSWYFLNLEVRTPILVYIYSFIGTIIIALAEVWLVKKCRSKDQ
ncbi:MAG: c-type cytochrome [Candidatus Scalinduaceae bacterium]